jgi:hypothetical protein
MGHRSLTGNFGDKMDTKFEDVLKELKSLPMPQRLAQTIKVTILLKVRVDAVEGELARAMLREDSNNIARINAAKAAIEVWEEREMFFKYIDEQKALALLEMKSH